MRQKHNFTSRTMAENEREPVSNKQAFSSFDIELFKTKPKTKKGTNTRFQVANTFLEPEKQQSTENSFENTISDDELKATPLEKLKLTVPQQESRDKLIDVLFIVGTIYFCFLTFGVWTTSYHYDDNGKIVAQPMSYEDIVEKKSFETLITQYMECRNLYEKILSIDKQLADGKVQPFTLAPSYEAIVTEAETLYTKTEALSIDVQYEQIRTMYLTWLKDNLATYCKNMSTAISQNNKEVAQTALYNREKTYSDFSLITQNIIAMGEVIPGIDLVNIKEWDATDIYKK